MKRIMLYYLVFIIAFAFVGCGDNSNNTPPPPPTYKISGTILTLGDEPIGGVSVLAGGKTATSNASGQYTLNDVEINESIGIQFTKNGYTAKNLTVSKSDAFNREITLNVDMLRVFEDYTVVTGIVKNDIDEVIQGASVSISGFDSVLTDSEGKFSFGGEGVAIDAFVDKNMTVSYLSNTKTIAISSEHFVLNNNIFIADYSIVLADTPILAGKTTNQLFAADLLELNSYSGSYSNINNANHIKNNWQIHIQRGSGVEDNNSGMLALPTPFRTKSSQKYDDYDVFIYAKIHVSDANKILAAATKTFSSQNSVIAFMVVKQDGTVATLRYSGNNNPSNSNHYGELYSEPAIGANWSVFGNSKDVTFEYDLSEYKNQTIVIAYGIIGTYVFTDDSNRQLRLGINSISLYDSLKHPLA